MHHWSKPGEFEDLVDAAEPVVEVADRDPDDTAVILYTSGTTGQAEGRRAHARRTWAATSRSTLETLVDRSATTT